MSLKNTNNLIPNDYGIGKVKDFVNVKVKILELLKLKSMTMKEIGVALGKERTDICWYLAPLRENNQVRFTRLRRCSISNRNGVMEFTANPELFQEDNQLKMLLL